MSNRIFMNITARAALLCLCAWFLLDGAVAGRLVRQDIVHNKDEALCNDYSDAHYYLEEVPDAEGWVIFFEGGGGCSTPQDCNDRYRNESTKILMSSHQLEAYLLGYDLLSNDSDANPLFYNYNHVLVPYCSQDAYLANSQKPSASFSFLDDPDRNSFVFRGRIIFQSIIEDLVMRLVNSSKVVLAGSSAGGIGIMNNVNWVQDTVNNATLNGQTPPELAVIIDSSWFIPFNGYHAINFSIETAIEFNISSPACRDRSIGVPCCTSLACLLTNNDYLSKPVPPVFAITSIYDIFTLEESLKVTLGKVDLSNGEEFSDQDFLRLFNTYGALINGSLVETYKTQHLNISIFAPSCTQHVYLATSSLWDAGGMLNSTVDGKFTQDVFVLTNPVQNGLWNSITINTDNSTTLSLRSALETWYNDPGSVAFYSDTCNGPACGTCPSGVTLEPSVTLWPIPANIAILTLSAVMAAIPVMVKLLLYVCMKCMLFQQKIYVYNIKQTQRYKPRFPKAVHAVSVACSGLYYLLDTVDNTKKEPEIDKETQQLSQSHYKLSALTNTVMPCCKPLCSRYNAPVCDSESGHLNNRQKFENHTPTHLNGLRPDSGISSSIVTNSKDNSSSADSLDVTSMDFILESNTPVHRARPERTTQNNSLKKKTILRHVNMYVNPGELLAIMGPSGSGKTTLLDVLLGRRRAGRTQGEIFVNGIPLTKMREWFIMNTGYVRQLATSFYNELTVRENLLFSMNMQAPSGMTLSQKLERVEQVIRETGLQEQADFVVGNGIGLGLSGGQRKRLTIAVQLLSMPNIIFLDEPTSGLDSASSLDILKSLQVMANTGRAIVVTIHQPRSEIFHAFDKILLLCNGQVAFFGSPVKVWEFFRKALINEDLEKNEGQVQDQILDHLKEKKSQDQVLSAYRESLEPKKVRSAVLHGRDETDSIPPPMFKRYPGFWHRLVSLESRASLRQTLFTIIYLPVVYTVFGVLLGTTYLRTQNPVQIMSVTCLLSCSSSLFMSSIVLSLLVEPLKLFDLEHSDGISSAHELILQVYFRMSAVGTLPLAVCATIVFALVYLQESFQVYATILLAFLLVNQVWISIFVLLTVTAPSQAHRLCPVFAAIGGFCCGFIVPKPLMPEYYRWVFYINPSYYAYSATSVTVLNGLDLECNRESSLECFRTSGYAVLSTFGIDDVNPFAHLLILMAMTIIILLIAILILELKVSAGLIKDSIVNGIYSCHKKNKNKESKVASSTDNLNEVDTPVQLRSFRKNRLQGQTKESMQKAAEDALSNEFIEYERHHVHHNFPWERALDEQQDAIDGTPTLFSPRSTTSRRSRIASDGSEDVFEPPELITMDEEADQDERKKQAEQKWNQRRIKIESEIHRLREMNHNRAAMRHSIASFGDDLEYQVFSEVRRDSLPRKRYLSTANEISESHDGSAGLEIETSRRQNVSGGKPPFLRASSLPTTQAMFNRIGDRGVPTLDTYEEEEEAEMMGLPPKDIPHLRESMENLERISSSIDYREIPPEQLTEHSSQESADHWSDV